MSSSFLEDVKKGLSSSPKILHSKYFYDDNGSRLFQEIMKMPEYYLTDSEFEILSLQSKKIMDAVAFEEPFNIIELGAGDGFKTFKLLEYLVKKKVNFNYIPIDISQQALNALSQKLKTRLPSLNIKPQVGDYFEVLKKNQKQQIPNLLLFLGSNIGNYFEEKALELLRLFNNNINPGDKMLIGMDLKKNPATILNAYNDPHGITKKFNLNLLIRINRELGANFKIDDFDFYCHYNPLNGEVRSYLVSLRKQEVTIEKADVTVAFAQNEIIWTELSKKFDLDYIKHMAMKSGFKVNENFLDCKHYFTDSLWEKM